MRDSREPDPVAHRTLRIDVDEQRLPAASRQRARQVDGGRGLADPSLLADDGENSSP
jgi:hypothetical protein